MSAAMLSRLTQDVVSGIDQAGVAQRAAEEAARRVKAGNDTLWEEVQNRLTAAAINSAASVGLASEVMREPYAPTLPQGSSRMVIQAPPRSRSLMSRRAVGQQGILESGLS